MRALVLDFDGVIFDSARESFEVALRSYLELRPESRLVTADRDRLYAEFLTLMPLGNGADDYGATMAALDAGEMPSDQETYDRIRAAHDGRWLADYHRRFYEVRAALAEQNPQGWYELMPPYGDFAALLRERRGSIDYAIATAKDRRSVDRLLAAHGLGDLFRPEWIEDKTAGPDKSIHLRRLQERMGHPFGEMTFVDDKVNHLDRVSTLGVRCCLAAWGYNSPREHALAQSRGYVVCTLDNVAEKLFDERPPVQPARIPATASVNADTSRSPTQ